MANIKNRWAWLGLALALATLLLAFLAQRNNSSSPTEVETTDKPPQHIRIASKAPGAASAGPDAMHNSVADEQEKNMHANPDTVEPTGPRNYRELMELAKNASSKSPQEVLFDNVTSIDAIDGVFHLPAAGTTYQLTPESRQRPLRLRLRDDGVRAGDANPVARFTGPSGRHLVKATSMDGAVAISLPETTLANGVYILDINPHRPRTSQQRRYILQLSD